MNNTIRIELPPEPGDRLCDWRNAVAALQMHPGPKELILQSAVYRFGTAAATRWHQAATNSLEAGEDPTHPVAIFLREIDDLTIRGNGATLLLLADMSVIGVDHCRNLTLCDFHIDYQRPRVSEMRVEGVNEGEMLVSVHPDSPYILHDGKLEWTGPGWSGTPKATADLFQVIDGATGSNLRSIWNPLREAREIGETAPGQLLFRLPPDRTIPVKPGDVLLCRHTVRDQVTALFHESENIRLDRLSCHASTGLGFTFQMCEDIAISALYFAPAAGSGRHNSAFADHLHFSGCRGRVEITDSFLAASQDDPINIHGTYLAVTSAGTMTARLRFMHPQSWGFNPFHAGDEVALIDADTLTRVATNQVESSLLTDGVTVQLQLRTPWPPGIAPTGKFLENLSAYPEVGIRRCRFASYPTRGILLSSAKKSVIEECDFEQKAPFAAILIAGDARSWYESGGVSDVTIRHNRFFDSPVSAIEINPEVFLATSAAAVHATIRIHDNEFHRCQSPCITAHHVADLQLSGNRESVYTR